MLYHVTLQRAPFFSRTNLPGTSDSAVCAILLWRGQQSCRAISSSGRHRWQVCWHLMFLLALLFIVQPRHRESPTEVTENISRCVVFEACFTTVFGFSRFSSQSNSILFLSFFRFLPHQSSWLLFFVFSTFPRSHSFDDFPSLFLSPSILKRLCRWT